MFIGVLFRSAIDSSISGVLVRVNGDRAPSLYATNFVEIRTPDKQWVCAMKVTRIVPDGHSNYVGLTFVRLSPELMQYLSTPRVERPAVLLPHDKREPDTVTNLIISLAGAITAFAPPILAAHQGSGASNPEIGPAITVSVAASATVLLLGCAVKLVRDIQGSKISMLKATSVFVTLALILSALAYALDEWIL